MKKIYSIRFEKAINISDMVHRARARKRQYSEYAAKVAAGQTIKICRTPVEHRPI